MPHIIEFEVHSDHRGELIVIEKCIPFEIKRVFYIRNIPGDETRGYHAQRTGHQVIVPIDGTFNVRVTDGIEDKTHRLASPNQGLYIKPMEWHSLFSFIPGAICLVLASDVYDESDYIRDYNEFLKEALGEGLLLH